MPLPEPVSQVVAGVHHSCAIRESDGTVVCWGSNAYPSRPGAFESISAGFITCGIRPTGQLVCWGGHGSYINLHNVPVGVFSQVAVGEHHVCALYAGDSSVVCWSDGATNYYGHHQIHLNEPFVSISSGDFLTCGLRADGTKRCWGRMVWNPR